ncbi:copper ABC transporter permease [Halobaculum halobium]|uniref:Copper ABC transporter permease n=1 Tax=Halobaculum halobium TaxID=3032281 RepID=A0ABD5T4V7_9EURY|nr:copper ABC transporter permease [Halobaculum sp. SYNS20]
MSRRSRTAAVFDRELRTLVRTRSLLAVAAAFALIVIAVAGGAVGAPGGYVSLTLDLLTVVEVLVPVLSFGIVYRSIRGDAERSELDVIRTYPISRVEYVVGVYLGRTFGVLAVVSASLAVAGALASFASPSAASFLATHSAGDSPIVFVRFVALAMLYALTVSAVITAASAAARTTREALAVGVALVVAVAVGLDLAIVGLLSGGVVGGGLEALLGVSPAAFRGLVIELAVAPALASPPPIPAASPAVSLFGLAGWTAISLGIACLAVWR